MNTLYKRTMSNYYKVELEEIRSKDPDGDEFTVVWMKKYIRRGNNWELIDRDEYVYWDIELVTMYYIESLGYMKENKI